MMRPRSCLFVVGLVFCPCTGQSSTAAGGEPVTLDSVIDPGANSPDEPLAEAFSLERALHFLDSAALTWQKQRQCFTCHTNYVYLYARPLISPDAAAHRSVREFAEQLITQRWETDGPRWDAEVVATAAALAFNDRVTTGRLAPETRRALDRMWTVQREDGGITWISCGWPPMESDDHYGVTLAALAASVAPDDYANTDQARRGIEGLRRYFENNKPATLHHRMMLLWVSQHLDDLMSQEQQRDVIAEVRSLQHADGGWALAGIFEWTRADGSPQDKVSSDGYGTGFSVYVLREAGVPADDPAIVRGIGGSRRISGRAVAGSRAH